MLLVKWKKARFMEWIAKQKENGGHEWRGVFWTKNVCLCCCFWQFGLGDPEAVFTTEGSQEFRQKRVFGKKERTRGSVIRHSGCHWEFVLVILSCLLI